MPRVRGLRTIKKEILKLIETYVEKADDLEMVRTNIVPALLDAVLVDYNRNVPNARDAEVLKVMSAIITKLSVRWTPHRSRFSVVQPLPTFSCSISLLSSPYRWFKVTDFFSQALMEDQVPNIMENVFECTLEMINKDFSEFPEHRVEFFTLLRAINLQCFPGMPCHPLP